MVHDSERMMVLEQATFHLYLIKKRMLLINNIVGHLRTLEVSFDYIIEIDNAYIHVRKSIEEIMLLSLCAHDFAGEEISQKLRKSWHATKIMQYLRNINPEFFPAAIDIVPSNESGITSQFVSPVRVFLKEEDAIEMYDICGDVLHSNNKPMDLKMIKDRYNRLVSYNNLIRGLFETFTIDARGWTICGHINIDDQGPPKLFYAPIVRDSGGGGIK